MNNLTPPTRRELLEALYSLQQAESRYRLEYEHGGGFSLEAGSAWENIRRAGHRAREIIARETMFDVRQEIHAERSSAEGPTE